MKVVTLTLSPAGDLEYRAPVFTLSTLNRAPFFRLSAGGKGINVSRAILCAAKADGRAVDLKTVVPLGGPAGGMIRASLDAEGIPVTAVPIAAETRLNVSLIPDSGAPTEINAPGAPVGDRLGAIEDAVLDGIGPGDVVVIAGSVPSDVPKSYPSALVAKVRKTGAAAVLDCDGEALRIAVNAPVDERPNLIKPNEAELCELVGLAPGARRAELVKAAEGLGIEHVITTLAGDGAMLTSADFDCKTVHFPAERQKVVRLKGAGDTFLGAFVYAYFVRQEPTECAMEVATGAAGRYVAGE